VMHCRPTRHAERAHGLPKCSTARRSPNSGDTRHALMAP
jgi:hypothetical protein